jgi:hypothetical protein
MARPLRRKLSFSFGQYTTVFQAEVYACGISIGVAKRAVGNWTNRNRKKNIGNPYVDSKKQRDLY